MVGPVPPLPPTTSNHEAHRPGPTTRSHQEPARCCTSSRHCPVRSLVAGARTRGSRSVRRPRTCARCSDSTAPIRHRHLGAPPCSALLLGLLPPGRAPLAEGDLRCVDPCAGRALVVGPACAAYVAPPRHQDPGELRPPLLRDGRVGGSPTPAVDHDVPPVRGDLGRPTHPLRVGTTGPRRPRGGVSLAG